MAKNIIIICGEPSGDLNAANLAKKILSLDAKIKISAVGGELLASAGAEIFYNIKDISVMGLFEALKKLPKFFGLKKLVLAKIAQIKPDALILVDFSGFNLRLAKAINNKIPLIYYVSPQVWASRQGRVKTIKEYIDKMIVLFKFEEEFYKKFAIDVDFVGHPLLDIVKPTMKKEELFAKLNLSDAKTTIALLPGSRNSEINQILPVMLGAASVINEKIGGFQFIIAKSPGLDWDIYNRQIKKFKFDIRVVEGKTYDCINTADFCFVCSGTATLETAILGKPFAVIYKMGLLNYLLYRPQVKIPYISLVNILAKKEVVPEFIQFKATSGNIAKQVIRILKNPDRLEQIREELAKIKVMLGEPGACQRAAQIVVNFLNKPR